MQENFKIEKNNKILIISFTDKENQSLVMSGTSCYYEDPEFYKKYIYKYNLLGNSKIHSNSYEGHNMSLNKMIKYYELAIKNRDILYEENILYNKLLKYKKKNYKYVITKCNDDKSTLEHEIKHTQFYFNKKYRKYVKMVWKSLDDEIKELIIEYLKCYNEKLYVDEFQAYITTEPLVFIQNKKTKKTAKKYEKIKKELNQISNLLNNWLKNFDD